MSTSKKRRRRRAWRERQKLERNGGKQVVIIPDCWNRLPDGTRVLDEQDLEYIDIDDPMVLNVEWERFVVRLFCTDKDGDVTDILLGTLRDYETGYFDALFCVEGGIPKYGHTTIDQLLDEYEHIEKDEGFIFVSGHELIDVVYFRSNYESVTLDCVEQED